MKRSNTGTTRAKRIGFRAPSAVGAYGGGAYGWRLRRGAPSAGRTRLVQRFARLRRRRRRAQPGAEAAAASAGAGRSPEPQRAAPAGRRLRLSRSFFRQDAGRG